MLTDELIRGDFHKRVFYSSSWEVFNSSNIFRSIKPTCCAVGNAVVRRCCRLITLTRHVSCLRLVMRTIVVVHTILVYLSLLLLLIFEIRMLLLVRPTVTIWHRTVSIHGAAVVLIRWCHRTCPRPPINSSIITRIHCTVVKTYLMIALSRHTDDLLSIMILLLLPGFMSSIVHLTACFDVFSGGNWRAIHICLRFVDAKNLIIRLGTIHLLICIICIILLVCIITSQISYTLFIISWNFIVTILL